MPLNSVHKSDEPRILLNLTNNQQVISNKVKSHISSLIVQVSQATEACGKLLESLVQFLDPSWEYTQSVSSVTADIQAALNDFASRLNKRLALPMEKYMEQHKTVKMHVHNWKVSVSQSMGRGKMYSRTRQRVKENTKTRNTKLDSRSAPTLLDREDQLVSRKLIRLNNEGIIACCKTWFILIDSYTKLVDTMPPLLNRLQEKICSLHKDASHNSLPPWTLSGGDDVPSKEPVQKAHSAAATRIEDVGEYSYNWPQVEGKKIQSPSSSQRAKKTATTVPLIEWASTTEKAKAWERTSSKQKLRHGKQITHEPEYATKHIKGHFGFRYDCPERYIPSTIKISPTSPQTSERMQSRRHHSPLDKKEPRAQSQLTIIRDSEPEHVEPDEVVQDYSSDAGEYKRETTKKGVVLEGSLSDITTDPEVQIPVPAVALDSGDTIIQTTQARRTGYFLITYQPSEDVVRHKQERFYHQVALRRYRELK